ncbi:MAG: type II secretion system protein [Planctomycetes bacterium]|nr:type II secretion system protein [Planctomycetota bacterium]
MIRHGNTGRRAFSLLELVIVMLILAVLAAIAIPRFSATSENAKTNALQRSLQLVRDRLEAYKAEHAGAYPDLKFVEQMTQYSDDRGNVSPTPDPRFPLGPYLSRIPDNPFSGSNAVRFLLFEGQALGARLLDRGWTYNIQTGEFAPDLTDTRALVDGTLLNTL